MVSVDQPICLSGTDGIGRVLRIDLVCVFFIVRCNLVVNIPLTAPYLFRYIATVIPKELPIEAYACQSAAHKPTSSSLDPSAYRQHNQVEC
eukprot:scaffold4003_cov165-Amphora_coffeaeformis.AAC.13